MNKLATYTLSNFRNRNFQFYYHYRYFNQSQEGGGKSAISCFSQQYPSTFGFYTFYRFVTFRTEISEAMNKSTNKMKAMECILLDLLFSLVKDLKTFYFFLTKLEDIGTVLLRFFFVLVCKLTKVADAFFVQSSYVKKNAKLFIAIIRNMQKEQNTN